MRRIGILVSLVALAALARAGVAGPPPLESESAIRMRLGRDALKAGKPEAARHHFLDAIALDPAHAPAWSALATLDGSDPDARALLALDAVSAIADAAGKAPKAPFGAALAPADLAGPLDLAAKRAALSKAIADAAGKLSGGANAILAKWIRLLAAETASGAATLGAPARVAADRAVERCGGDGAGLRAALIAALNEAKAAGNLPRAVEAARLLVGLASQRRGARGSRVPPMEAMGPRFALDEARAALRSKAPPPLAFADLEKLFAPELRRPFEDAHSTFSDPIVVTSSKGRYRIESVCGLHTTREAADLIEHCHDRLVAWCGKDPFGGRQGVVRLCPTYAELEAEGQPYWWAQGFASGDVLTVVVQWSTGNELAGLLAHELTHRFDGALFSGLPSWVLEGRAMYVGAMTSDGRAAVLDERAVDFHELGDADRVIGGWYDGLTDILSGKDPEYRHNYPVGYALWTFLSQWTGPAHEPDGPMPYRSRIPALLKALEAAPSAPVRVLEATLCDGLEGRATNLGQLAKQFFDFLRGLDEDLPPAWARAWLDRSSGSGAERTWDYALLDRSNFPTVRHRLDPPAEGEAIAAMAAAFFEAGGKAPEALEAHGFADAVDEVDVARYRRALALETAGGRKEAAFARRRLLARMVPMGVEPAKADLGALAPVEAAAAIYLDAVAKAAGDAAAASKPRTARALRAEHDCIALLVGGALLGDAGLAAAPTLEKGARHGDPDCPPALNPLAAGVVEEHWSAQADGALSGLFVLPSPDALELGRRGTGPVATGDDRDARWVGVAVRTVESLVGTYTVRARVRPAGAYVSGRVIVGWTRRDRGVEFRFFAGDRTTAEKTGESAAGASGADVSISDLREVDGRTTTLSRHIALTDVADGRAGFELAVHVSGPFVRVEVDGRDALSFRRVTGEPVEGSVGFVIDRGRTLFSEVRAERHRVLGPEAACRCARFDAPLDLAVPARFSWTSLVGRRVVGLPGSEHTRLLLWSTGLAAADPTGAASILGAIESCSRPFVEHEYPLDVHVAARGEPGPSGALAMPAGFPTAEALSLHDDHVHLHHGFPGLDADLENIPQSYELGWPGWGGIFIDPSGVVRSRGPIDDALRGLRLARILEGR